MFRPSISDDYRPNERRKPASVSRDDPAMEETRMEGRSIRAMALEMKCRWALVRSRKSGVNRAMQRTPMQLDGRDPASTANPATGSYQHVEGSVLTQALLSHYSRKVRHTLWCISEKRGQKDGNQPGEGAAAHLTQRERTAHYFCDIIARTLHMLILRQRLCQAKRSWYLELQSLQKDNRWWCLDSIDALSCDRQIVRFTCRTTRGV